MYNADDYRDATVYDSQGDKVGKVEDLFIDEETGRPEWVQIDTGVLAPHALVPAEKLSRSEDGWVAPYTTDHITSAPRVDAKADTISQTDERKLYEHYDVQYGSEGSGTLLPEGEVSSEVTPEGASQRTSPIRMSGSAAAGEGFRTPLQTEVPLTPESLASEAPAEQEPAAEGIRRDMLGEESSGGEMSSEEAEAERRRLEREREDDTRAA